jgi:phosphoribosylformylglycinamidine synthase subunit PurSL
MTWRVYVQPKPQFVDHAGKALEKEWRAAGLSAVKKIRVGQAYEISGELSPDDVTLLAEKLLTDPITQAPVVAQEGRPENPAQKNGAGVRRAEIWPKPGVADPVAETVALGARDLGLAGVRAVRSGAVYEFWGAPSPKQILTFCESHLMNPLVQRVEIDS